MPTLGITHVYLTSLRRDVVNDAVVYDFAMHLLKWIDDCFPGDRLVVSTGGHARCRKSLAERQGCYVSSR